MSDFPRAPDPITEAAWAVMGERGDELRARWHAQLRKEREEFRRKYPFGFEVSFVAKPADRVAQLLKVNWSVDPGYVPPDPMVLEPTPPGFPDRDGNVYIGMARVRHPMQLWDREGNRGDGAVIVRNYGKRQRIALQYNIGSEGYSFRRWNRPEDKWRPIAEDNIIHDDVNDKLPDMGGHSKRRN